MGLFHEGFVLTQQVAWMTQLFSGSPSGFYISMLVTAQPWAAPRVFVFIHKLALLLSWHWATILRLP